MCQRSAVKNMLAVMLLALLIISGAAPGFSQEKQVSGKVFPEWFAAVISGSDRLAVYSLLRNGIDARRFLATVGGLHQGATPDLVARSVSAYPILYYASNFNEGVPGDRITVGGLAFAVDDESKAKKGIALGVGGSAGIIASYAKGSVVRMNASVSAEALASKSLKRGQIAAGACIQQYVTGWTWLDGCFGGVRVLRNYDNEVTQYNLSFGPKFIFHVAGADHQTGVTATRIFRDAGPQNGVEFSWIGAARNTGAISASFGLTEKLEGENTTRRYVGVGLTRPIARRIIGMNLNYRETGGFLFFGTAREDRVFSASFTVPLTPRITISSTVGRRNSNIDAYDENFGLINFANIKW